MDDEINNQESEKHENNSKVGWYVVVISIVLLIAVMFFVFRGGDSNVTGNTISESIKIPLSQVSEKAEWFEYKSGGKTIKYFVVKAKDGSIKTAFDACDVCYGSKKGYRQQGDDMICNNCGNYYAISGLGTKNLKGGGCWPGYLLNRVEGDYLIIKQKDLNNEAYRFK